MSYKEQREWEQMESAILTSETAVTDCERDVEKAGAASDHVRLQEACHALQEARVAVERLYARWAELEAKQQ